MSSVSLVGHALCSIADVKLRLPQDQSDQADALIAVLINSFSTYAENYTQRKFQYTARTSYFDGVNESGSAIAEIQLPAFPIASSPALQIWQDSSRAFASDALLTENTDYVINSDTGTVRKISPTIFADMQPSYSYYGARLERPRGMGTDCWFAFGHKTIKVTWTGGIVTARAASPTTPTLAEGASGVLSGTYRYGYSTINASGEETALSVEAPITVTDKRVTVTFVNPGAGYTVRLYRSQEGYSTLYHLADVAGGATTTYSDNIADGSLDQGVAPYGAGPLSVPDDLREAAMMQVTDWFGRRNEPGVSRVSSSGGNAFPGGSASYQDKMPILPFVGMVLDTYRTMY